MQSSPNRSESASTTTRPRAVLGDGERAARPAAEALAKVRASTRRAVAERERRRRGRSRRRRRGPAGRPRRSRWARRRRHGLSWRGPRTGRRVVVLVVLHGVVARSRGRSGASRSLRLLPYFVLLGLAEHDQPAAARARTPRSRRARRREKRGEPVPVGRLPLRVGRDGRSRARRRRPSVSRGQRAGRRWASTSKSRAASALGRDARRRSPRGAPAASRAASSRTDRPRLASGPRRRGCGRPWLGEHLRASPRCRSSTVRVAIVGVNPRLSPDLRNDSNNGRR